MQELYIYGSETPNKYSLLHIADDTGKPLCGNEKIKDGKTIATITRIDESKIFALKSSNEPEKEIYRWQTHYCSMCKKRLNKLLNNQQIKWI